MIRNASDNVLGLLLAAIALYCQASSFADEQASSFVIGFERFARHQELSSEDAGRLLLTELSCTSCHSASSLGQTGRSVDWEPKSGPKLESAGRRLNSEWIALFLNAPSHTKPGTTMPDVLAGLEPAQKSQTIAALVAFLASEQAPFPELKASGLNPVLHEFWNKGDAARGKELMHRIGCVACHEPASDVEGGVPTDPAIEALLENLDQDAIARLGMTHAVRTIPSVPFANLRDKYTAQGLAMFLFDPLNVRPAGRMPNMKLRTSDAADLSAWLVTNAPSVEGTAKGTPNRVEVNPKLRTEGQLLFNRLGCANCHTASGATPRPAKPLQSLAAESVRSCIAPKVTSGIPHYQLDNAQRSAMASALAELNSAPTGAANQPPSDKAVAARAQVNMSMLQLNCYACHQRDGRGGVARGRDRFFETVGQVDLGDEGRLPPPLTHVGRKLTTPWLRNALLGNVELRPHLQIRMPKFPNKEVEPLSGLLASADGVAVTPGQPAKPEPVDQDLANAGRTLFNLGCVQCHSLKGESLPGVVGVDVGYLHNRVRPQWFHDFLLNPASLKPRTRMPTFFAPGSVNQEVLSGDVEKQIQALWAYLVHIDSQQLPEKIEQARRQDFELIPKDKPIVLRTFMQLAGTHAIAVGFPERSHYAFDAESVRLAELWSDRFVDAQATWNDRFAPLTAPLSSQRIPLPVGSDFALLPNRTATWPEVKLDSPVLPPNTVPIFLGYQLKGGVPEFQYEIGPFRISDRTVAAAPQNVPQNTAAQHLLVRELVVGLRPGANPPSGSNLWFRVAGSSKPLERLGNGWKYASGLTVSVSPELARSTFARSAGGQTQVILPCEANTAKPIRVEYSWK